MKKAREDSDAKWNGYSGLQDTIPADQWAKYQAHIQGLRQNPIGQIESLINEALSHPELSAVARQRIAALVNAGQTQQAAVEAKAATAQVDDDPRPQPDMDGGYSAKQLEKLDDWNQRKALAKFKDEFKPVFEAHEKAKQAHEFETLKAEKKVWAEGVFAKVQSKLEREFGDVKSPEAKQAAIQIATEFKTRLPSLGTDPHDSEVKALLLEIYTDVVTPSIGKMARSKALDDLDTKARATTTSPTSHGRAVIKPKPQEFRAALAESFRTR